MNLRPLWATRDCPKPNPQMETKANKSVAAKLFGPKKLISRDLAPNPQNGHGFPPPAVWLGRRKENHRDSSGVCVWLLRNCGLNAQLQTVSAQRHSPVKPNGLNIEHSAFPQPETLLFLTLGCLENIPNIPTIPSVIQVKTGEKPLSSLILMCSLPANPSPWL